MPAAEEGLNQVMKSWWAFRRITALLRAQVSKLRTFSFKGLTLSGIEKRPKSSFKVKCRFSKLRLDMLSKAQVQAEHLSSASACSKPKLIAFQADHF